jgi:hypothetical protein
MAATAARYTPRTTIDLSYILGRKFFRKRDYVLDTGSTNEVLRPCAAPWRGSRRKSLGSTA